MKLIADRAAEPSWRCVAWSGGSFAYGWRWFAQRRSSRRSGWSGRDRPSRSRGRQRRTSRYTEQPPALARADALSLSNVGLSADVHRRAAVGELVVMRKGMHVLPPFVRARRLLSIAVGGSPSVRLTLFLLRRVGRRAARSSESAVGAAALRSTFPDGRSWSCLARGRNRITRRWTEQP